MPPAGMPTPWVQVPVEPDAPEGRRWAEEELAKAVYQDEPSLLERLAQWFLDLLEAVTDLGGTTPPQLVPVAVVLLAAGVLAVALLLAGPIRRRRRLRAATAGSHELFDDERSSQQLRASADAAAARGDYAIAVLERFRSVVRALDERAVLDDRPGMTAHEAAGLAGAALPAHAAGLQWAGRLFDDVRYGAAAPGPDEDEVMRDLAEQVATARTEPLRAEVP